MKNYSSQASKSFKGIVKNTGTNVSFTKKPVATLSPVTVVTQSLNEKLFGEALFVTFKRYFMIIYCNQVTTQVACNLTFHHKKQKRNKKQIPL